MASETVFSLGTKSNLMGRIVWSSVSNGSVANTSDVTARIEAKKTSNTTIATTGVWTGSLNIGGTSKSFSVTKTIGSSTWITLKSFTITIGHNADGTGTCYLYGKIKGPSGTTLAGYSVSESATATLDTIPRFATITSAPNFNDEENPTIEYSNPAGESVTSLRACISLDGSNDDITYRDISKTGSSYTFNLTSSERNVLRAATTESNSRTVKFYVRSEIGTEYEGSNLSRIFTIKDPEPTITPTIVDTNSATIALTGDSSKLVRYYSNAKITIGATAVKHATLTSKKVICGNKSLTTDGTINAVDSNKFVFTATDSRGNTTNKTVTPTFVDYIKLSCNLANNMPTADGSMTVKATGNYFNGSFGSKSNTLEVYYRYKTIGGSYNNWTVMTATLSGNTYSATTSITGLDYQSTYVFQAYAVDSLATVYSVEKNVKATPVFDWGESDFKFNVPVYDEFGMQFDNGLCAYESSGIDANTTVEHLVLTNKNVPSTAFYYVHTFFYNTKSTSANRAQFAIPYNFLGTMYFRTYYNGSWSQWWAGNTYQSIELHHSTPYIDFHHGSSAADYTQRIITSSGGLLIYGTTSNYVAVMSDRFRSSGNDIHYLGDSSNKWKAVYAVNGTIQTSDRNQKTNIQEIDQKYIDLFDKLQPVTFEFSDNESDRVHVGFISQDVKDAMDEVGLTDLDFAGYCRDVKMETEEIVDPETEITTYKEHQVTDENGDPVYTYSLRYSEFIALNSRMIQLNRQKIAEQEQKIAEQEQEIQSLRKELDDLKTAVAALLN